MSGFFFKSEKYPRRLLGRWFQGWISLWFAGTEDRGMFLREDSFFWGMVYKVCVCVCVFLNILQCVWRCYVFANETQRKRTWQHMIGLLHCTEGSGHRFNPPQTTPRGRAGPWKRAGRGTHRRGPGPGSPPGSGRGRWRPPGRGGPPWPA